MTTEINKTKRHILVELRIKGYTEQFLKNFLIFFKQRFFKNFLKLGGDVVTFNKYTLLRSSFINKSSREQIEKRIHIKKINLIFLEFDFKLFYSTLNSLSFKGISLKISKFYFLCLKNKINGKFIKNYFFDSNLFLLFWENLSFKNKNLILSYSKKRKLNQVFTTISCKQSLSKHIGLKFLKKKSLRKNRIRKGLFKTAFKKPNWNQLSSFEKSFLSLNLKKQKNILKVDRIFIRRNSSIFSLCYSYCFNNRNNKLNLFKYLSKKEISKYLSKKEIIQLYSKMYLLNSILRYRKFFIWSTLKNNRKKSDYRKGLSKITILDKFNIYYKLVLGLKISPFNLHKNIFLNKNFKFLLFKDKNFYLFTQLLKKQKPKSLNKVLNNKSFSHKTFNKINYSYLLSIFKKSKKNNRVSINPFLIRRYLTKKLDLKKKKKEFLLYEKKNSLIKFFNSHFHFRSKILLFLVFWYKNSLKQLPKRQKLHIKKRLNFFLKRNWGIAWKSKSKTKFFFKKRKKRKFWKKFNRKIKNKKKKKFWRKINIKKRYRSKKLRLRKRNLNLFKKKR